MLDQLVVFFRTVDKIGGWGSGHEGPVNWLDGPLAPIRARGNCHRQWLQSLVPFIFGDFSGKGLLGEGNGFLVVGDLVEQIKRCVAAIPRFTLKEDVEVVIQLRQDRF